MPNLLKNVYNKKIENSAVKKSFLFGIFKTKYYIERFNFEFRFCGIVIFKTKVNKGREKFYLFNVPFFIKSSRPKLYNKILNIIGGKYTDIYVNYNCSGETYLFLTFFKSFNRGSRPVFIATKPYHIDLCHLMCPEISCFYIPNLEKLRGFDSIFKETYKGFNFFNILPMKHFVNLEKRILKGENLHYYNEILKTAGVNSCDFKSQSPIVSERVKQSVLDKVSKIGLNTENFVFLCPESQSNLNPKDCFWADVINRFYSEGFDVFMNVMKLTPLYGTAKTCFLTMEEAYYLASLSKCIVGLRSGVMEPLTAINDIPILCLYSDFKDRGVLKSIPAEKVMSCFSLKNLPNASDNIYEYTFEQVNSDCIDKLISEVKF